MAVITAIRPMRFKQTFRRLQYLMKRFVTSLFLGFSSRNFISFRASFRAS